MSDGSCIHKIGALLYPCRIWLTVHCVSSSALNWVIPWLQPTHSSTMTIRAFLWTCLPCLHFSNTSGLLWFFSILVGFYIWRALKTILFTLVTPVSPRLIPFLNSEPLSSSHLLTWLIMANMDVLKQCHSGYESWHLEGSTSREGLVKKMCLSSWFRFGYLLAYYLYHYFLRNLFSPCFLLFDGRFVSCKSLSQFKH